MSKHYFTTCAAHLYPLFAYCFKEKKQVYEITIFVSGVCNTLQLLKQMADFQEICYKCGSTGGQPNNTLSQFPSQ